MTYDRPVFRTDNIHMLFPASSALIFNRGSLYLIGFLK